jgi:DNA modification methylase
MSGQNFLDGRVTLLAGDCLEILAALPESSVDSVVTDPPYGLEFMGKEWDKFTDAPRAVPKTGGRQAPFAHHAVKLDGTRGKGFQSFSELWAREAFRVLRPGGHLVAFSGTRTYHRMACAIEDAGFEIRDQIGWAYGSGFPKSHDVSKGIAKRAGGAVVAREAVEFMRARREELGLTRIQFEKRVFGRSDGNIRNWEDGISIPQPGLWPKIVAAMELKDTPFDDAMERGDVEVARTEGDFGFQQDGERWGQERIVRAPATDAAKQWQGWGTALKPAYEPVLFGAKPLTLAQAIAIFLEVITGEIIECLSLPASVAETLSIASKARSERVGAHTVLAPARMRVLASIEAASFAELASICQQRECETSPRTPENSAPSPAKANGSRNTASASATEPGKAAGSSNALTAIITSLLTGDTSESIATSWNKFSDDALSEPSTYTIATAIRLIIDLRTLRSCLCQITSTATGNFSPNWECIALARKPLIGTVAANVLEHGTGAINIDGCRVGAEGGTSRGENGSNAGKPRNTLHGGNFGIEKLDAGRWPANIVHDGSEEVIAAFPADCPSGGHISNRTAPKSSNVYGNLGCPKEERVGFPDSGSAARFFYTAKADAEDRLGSKHPTVKPLDLMQWLVRLVTPKGGMVLDPFAGTGTTGEAAWREGMRAILIEREPEYQADIARRMELAVNPTKRAAVAKTKNNLDNSGDLPLFAETAK